MDSRHPSACRPFLGRALSETEDRRADRDRRKGSSTSRSCGRRSTTGRIFPPTARSGTGCSRTARRSGSASMPVKVLFSPGHTLASITYVIGDAAFIHDTLFMPDSGTARADFPGGSAARLWRSIQDILALPDETRVFVGHDYQAGRPRAVVGKHGGRAEGDQHPSRRRAQTRPSSSPCARRATGRCRCRG